MRDFGTVILSVFVLALFALVAAKYHGKDDGPVEEAIEEAIEDLIENHLGFETEIINIDITPGTPEKE